MNKHIGEIIRNKRHEKGISLNDLSHITGISNMTLFRIENGNSNLLLENLIRICDVLQISLLEVLSDCKQYRRTMEYNCL